MLSKLFLSRYYYKTHLAEAVAKRCFASVASNEYDLAIIGGGPAGYVAAIKGA